LLLTFRCADQIPDGLADDAGQGVLEILAEILAGEQRIGR